MASNALEYIRASVFDGMRAEKLHKEYIDGFNIKNLGKIVHQLRLFIGMLIFIQIINGVLYILTMANLKPLLPSEMYNMHLVFLTVHTLFYLIALFLSSRIIKNISDVDESNQKNVAKKVNVILTVVIFFELVNVFAEAILWSSRINFIIFLIIILFVTFTRKRLMRASIISFSLLSLLITVVINTGIANDSLNDSITVIMFSIACYIIGTVMYNKTFKVYVTHEELRKTNEELLFSNEKLNELNETLETISTTDPLTQITNRRGFDQYLEGVWEECRRLEKPITIAMIDIDHFKQYNDEYGHIEGDECLKVVASEIKSFFNRSVDLVARYGGEEFVVVIPFCSGNNISALLEKVRMRIESLGVPAAPGLEHPYVTISVGIACRIPPRDKSKTSSWLIGIADEALYRAKNSGRNKIVVNLMDEFVDGKNDFTHLAPKNIAEDTERLQLVVRASTVGVFSYSFTERTVVLSRTISVSGDFERFLFDDYMKMSSFVHPNDRELFFTTMADIIKQHDDYSNKIVFRFQTAENTYKWVALSVRYIWSEALNSTTGEPEKTVSRVIGVMSDFSEQMRLQRINQLIATGSATYIYYFDLKKGTVFFNDKFREDFGIENTEIEDGEKLFYSLVVPKDKHKYMMAVKSVLKDGAEDFDCEVRVKSPKKGILWLKCRGKTNLDDDGKPDILAGSMTDVTETVKAEKLNKLIIEGSSSCVFVFDILKNVAEFSPQIKEISPFESLVVENALETWTKHIVSEDRQRFYDSFNKVMKCETLTYVAEYRMIGVEGTPVWVACRGKTLLDDEGRPALLAGTVFNLNSMGQYNKYIEERALSDRITGLPNRMAFYKDAAEYFKLNKVKGHVILLDIDDFKNVNSMYGLSTGDAFLNEVAALFTLNMSSASTDLYHLGGDTFLVHYKNSDDDEVVAFAKHMLDLVSIGLIVNDYEIRFTVSAGIVTYYSGDTVDEILTNADITIRKVKTMGKSKMAIFDPSDKESYLKRLEMESVLRTSIEEGFKGFEVHFQPFYDTKRDIIMGAEALLRWRDEQGKIIPPSVIIPCLQNISMFHKVERWVLRSAAEQCGKWIKQGAKDDLIINVNLSPSRAVKRSLQDEVKSVLEKNNLKTKNIVLEITEESLIMEMQANIQMLQELSNMGINLAVDDFGTGYSSLGYLRDLPISEIKIDRSFITDLETNPSSASFVSSIIQLSHSMNYIVCVEGVETEKQKEMLVEMNADILQGYFFSRPIPADEFGEKFLFTEKK